MQGMGTIGLLLIVANIAFSYRGFNNHSFLEGYQFEVDKILVNKDYKRLVTSGFLHVSWTHLIFNMISLLLFSGSVEGYLGWLPFLIIYFVSLVGGNLFSLLVHRHHSDYSAVGASGAVCGVIFASIALFPGMSIGIFLFPVSIPGWLYGVVYVLYSIYGIRSRKDNIGHDAHLGGAMIGMTVALLMRPAAIAENYVTILLIAVPTIIFIYIVITRPQFLLIDNYFFRTHKDFYSPDHKYNTEKAATQSEVDRILDKISRKGMRSLSEREKEILKKYSESGR